MRVVAFSSLSLQSISISLSSGCNDGDGAVSLSSSSMSISLSSGSADDAGVVSAFLLIDSKKDCTAFTSSREASVWLTRCRTASFRFTSLGGCAHRTLLQDDRYMILLASSVQVIDEGCLEVKGS